MLGPKSPKIPSPSVSYGFLCLDGAYSNSYALWGPVSVAEIMRTNLLHQSHMKNTPSKSPKTTEYDQIMLNIGRAIDNIYRNSIEH